MILELIEDYIDCQITQPFTAKIIAVKDLLVEDFEHYFNNGYEHLFKAVEEVENEIEKTPENNDLPE